MILDESLFEDAVKEAHDVETKADSFDAEFKQYEDKPLSVDEFLSVFNRMVEFNEG